MWYLMEIIYHKTTLLINFKVYIEWRKLIIQNISDKCNENT